MAEPKAGAEIGTVAEGLVFEPEDVRPCNAPENLGSESWIACAASGTAIQLNNRSSQTLNVW
jgi:hypothetical protein